MRSDTTIGLLRWINEHMFSVNDDEAEIARLLLSITVDEILVSNEWDSDALVDVCESYNIQVDEVHSSFGMALSLGVARNIEQVNVVSTPDGHATTLLPLLGQAHLLDGTVLRPSSSTNQRQLVGPYWDRNSCAADVILFTAMVLQIARLQIDQMSSYDHHQLNRPAQKLRMLVVHSLEELEGEVVNMGREQLRKAMYSYRPDKFGMGDLWSLHDAAAVLLSGHPALTFTTLLADICCDGRPNAAPANRSLIHQPGVALGILSHQSALYLTMDDMTNGSVRLNNVLSRIFAGIPNSGVGACTSGPHCTGKKYRCLHVVDRPPHYLHIFMPGSVGSITFKDCETMHAFDPFQVRIWTRVFYGALHRSGADRLRYTPYPYSALLTTFQYEPLTVWFTRNEHFFARTWSDGQVWEYDGLLRGGRSARVSSWTSGLLEGTRVISIIYRQKTTTAGSVKLATPGGASFHSNKQLVGQTNET